MFEILSDFRSIAAFKYCHHIVGLQDSNLPTNITHNKTSKVAMSAISLSVGPVNKLSAVPYKTY